MEPLRAPGSDDVAGRPRFRWKYIWWHAWPADPTRQDLRDFMFSSLLAVGATLVLGIAGLAAYTWPRREIWPEIWSAVWQRLDIALLAAVAVIVAYYVFVYWDWQRKRAA